LQHNPVPFSAYGTITLYRVAFQPTSAVIGLGCKRCKHTPHLYCIAAAIRFGLCRFRSPLLTVSQLISFPLATQMFPFAKVHVPQREQEKPRGDSPTKSHSGILGSTDACSYPRHIAACHALLRLPSQAIHHTASARRMVTFRRTPTQPVHDDHHKREHSLATSFNQHSACRSAFYFWLVLRPKFAESESTPNLKFFLRR
jgi:hypothetical protein